MLTDPTFFVSLCSVLEVRLPDFEAVGCSVSAIKPTLVTQSPPLRVFEVGQIGQVCTELLGRLREIFGPRVVECRGGARHGAPGCCRDGTRECKAQGCKSENAGRDAKQVEEGSVCPPRLAGVDAQEDDSDT